MLTRHRGWRTADGTITRDNLNVDGKIHPTADPTSGVSVIRKVVLGADSMLSMDSTGYDNGTGDVTLNSKLNITSIGTAGYPTLDKATGTLNIPNYGLAIQNDTNFAKTDLVFTGDRVHNLAAHTLSMSNAMSIDMVADGANFNGAGLTLNNLSGARIYKDAALGQNAIGVDESGVLVSLAPTSSFRVENLPVQKQSSLLYFNSVTGEITQGDLPVAIESISLATPSSVFNTPVNFINTNGAWSSTLSLKTQSQRTVLAAPELSAGLPSFRLLKIADISDFGNYIFNQTTLQPTSNFHISGSGVAEGYFSNVSGNNYFNTTGGSTLIGYALGGGNPSGFKLDVTGRTRFTGTSQYDTAAGISETMLFNPTYTLNANVFGEGHGIAIKPSIVLSANYQMGTAVLIQPTWSIAQAGIVQHPDTTASALLVRSTLTGVRIEQTGQATSGAQFSPTGSYSGQALEINQGTQVTAKETVRFQRAAGNSNVAPWIYLADGKAVAQQGAMIPAIRHEQYQRKAGSGMSFTMDRRYFGTEFEMSMYYMQDTYDASGDLSPKTAFHVKPTNTTHGLRVIDTGKVLIGHNTTSTPYILDVNGATKLYSLNIVNLGSGAANTILAIDANGNVVSGGVAGGASGVTQVAATVGGTALQVAGTPITTAGTLAFSWTGASTQIVRGDGSLTSMPVPSLGSRRVAFGSSANLMTDSPDLLWDDTSKFLSANTATTALSFGNGTVQGYDNVNGRSWSGSPAYIYAANSTNSNWLQANFIGFGQTGSGNTLLGANHSGTTQISYLPSADGTLAVAVKANGVTYIANSSGLIDLGAITPAPVVDTNFANTNLTLNANRLHQIGAYRLDLSALSSGGGTTVHHEAYAYSVKMAGPTGNVFLSEINFDSAGVYMRSRDAAGNGKYIYVSPLNAAVQKEGEMGKNIVLAVNGQLADMDGNVTIPVGGVDTNFATSDLTFTGDRTHNLADKYLRLVGSSYFQVGMTGVNGSATMNVSTNGSPTWQSVVSNTTQTQLSSITLNPILVSFNNIDGAYQFMNLADQGSATKVIVYDTSTQRIYTRNISSLAGTVTDADVLGRLLTGYTAGSNTPINSSNTILTALQNLQKQIDSGADFYVNSTLTGDATQANPLGVNAANLTGIPQAGVTGLVTALSSKQDTLVSGTSIKTVNGISLLGSGNITITTGAVAFSALTDVSLTSLANNQLVRYNSSTSKWENWTPNYLTTVSDADVLNRVLTGYTAGSNTPITSSNTILTALQNLQKQIDYGSDFYINSTLTGDASQSNPLGVNAANLTGIPQAGVTGLVSALVGKQDTLVSGVTLKTVNGISLLGSGNITITAGAVAFSGLTDVSLSSLANNQLVRYNSSTSKWENFTPSYITSVSDADVLNRTLTGYVAGSNTPISASNTVLTALQNLQKQIDAGSDFYINSTLTGDASSSNPLGVNAANLTGIPQAGITGLVTALSSKQDTLVSGTTIKTLNGVSLLGSGNITITATGGGDVYLANNNPFTGNNTFSGDVSISGGTNKVFSVAANVFFNPQGNIYLDSTKGLYGSDSNGLRYEMITSDAGGGTNFWARNGIGIFTGMATGGGIYAGSIENSGIWKLPRYNVTGTDSGKSTNPFAASNYGGVSKILGLNADNYIVTVDPSTLGTPVTAPSGQLVFGNAGGTGVTSSAAMSYDGSNGYPVFTLRGAGAGPYFVFENTAAPNSQRWMFNSAPTGNFSIADGTSGLSRFAMTPAGALTLPNLAGTGTRVMTADSTGLLSAPSKFTYDNTADELALAGSTFKSAVVFAGYNSIGSVLNSAALLIGSGIKPAAASNTVAKTTPSGWLASYVLGRSDLGVTFHTGIDGVAGSTFAENTTNVRMRIDHAGVVTINGLAGIAPKVMVADVYGQITAPTKFTYDDAKDELGLAGTNYKSAVVFGNYSSVGALASGAGFFMGTGLKPSANSNAFDKASPSGSQAHFFYTRYDLGLEFHTGIDGAAGSVISDTTNLRMRIDPSGNVYIYSLTGTGTRMMVVGADGKLATQAIPSGGSAVTDADVLGRTLTGYATGANSVISASNTVLTALQNLQAQITAGSDFYINSTLTGDASSGSPLGVNAANLTGIPQAGITGLVTALSGKQDTLVSGTTIKTLNGVSLLGSGDIAITGGGGGDVYLANNNPFTGNNTFSGDVNISGGTNKGFYVASNVFFNPQGDIYMESAKSLYYRTSAGVRYEALNGDGTGSLNMFPRNGFSIFTDNQNSNGNKYAFTLNASGMGTFPQYGSSSTFTEAGWGAVSYVAGFDGSGNIIKVLKSSIGGGGSGSTSVTTMPVYNSSGATITKGTPVYITGSNAGVPTIGPANATSASTTPAIGLVQADIANNSSGTVQTSGVLTGLNTSAYTAGARVLLGTTAGTLTNTQPTLPNHTQRIGEVVDVNATTGSINIDIATLTTNIKGTAQNDWQLGDGLATAKTLTFNASVKGMLSWLPTVARTLTLPDADGAIVSTGSANSYAAGMKQTFQSNSATAGTRWAGVTADPSTVVTGDLWYRSDLGLMRYYDGTVTQTVGKIVLTTLGDVTSHDGASVVRVAGNTTASKRFLTQTGTGVVSALPSWASIVASDFSGTATNGFVLKLVSGVPTWQDAGGITSSIVLSDNNTLGWGTATTNIEGSSTANRVRLNVASVTRFEVTNTGYTMSLLAGTGTRIMAADSTGGVSAQTSAQATALLDVFSSISKGLVPASSGGTATFLRADGTFAPPIGTYIQTVILPAGTASYTPSTGTTKVFIRMVGGGGAGGGGVAGSTTTTSVGAGGGAGGYLEKTVAVVAGTAYTCAVGAAGAGASGAVGGNGGSTTLTIGATTYTAAGGTGGTVGAAAAATLIGTSGAAGGAATNGDTNITGAGGGAAIRLSGTSAISGQGGDSPLGFGGRSVGTASQGSTVGFAGTGFGSGGSGGVSAAAAAAGGAGTAGIIIIDEYK